MYSSSDLRKGLKVEIDGTPYVITEFNFVKPGKGQGLYTCRFKSMLNGSTMVRTYRDNETFGQPNLEEKKVRYSYSEGDHLVFMDEDFSQLTVPADVMGDKRFFLFEDAPCEILFFNDRPVEVTLPTFVEKTIVETDPGARGNTATNVLKPAKIEGGYEIQIPLFVSQGDIVRIDTRTGEYVDRVRKK